MNSLISATAWSVFFHSWTVLSWCFLQNLTRTLAFWTDCSYLLDFFWAVYPASPKRRITVLSPTFSLMFFGRALRIWRATTPWPGGRTFLKALMIFLSSSLVVTRDPLGRPTGSGSRRRVQRKGILECGAGLLAKLIQVG